MKRKHLILLALIAVILGAVYFLRQESTGSSSPAETLLLPEEFSSDNIYYVQLKKNGRTITQDTLPTTTSSANSSSPCATPVPPVN